MAKDRGSQPRTVLHLISRLSVGGVENQLRLVCAHYDRTRIIPLVCCIREKGQIGREIERQGTEVLALGRKDVHGFSPSLVLEIWRLLKGRDIRILRTHQYEAGLYGRLAGLWAGTPVVIPSFHNIYRKRKPHRERINRILGMFSSRIVAVSECVKSEIVGYDRIPAGKVRVIYNGIDPAEFQGQVRTDEVKAALGLAPHCRILGTMGRMKTQKGQAFLLEAFAGLRRRMDDLRLLIVGDGPLRPDLEQRAKDLGIDKEVRFAGSRRDIYPFLSIMDLFVLPSLWEGMGTAIVEAMAAGRPVVASDIPPLREIIPSSELGLLVPPGDAKALERAVEQLLKEKGRSERMGKLAREYAESTFSIQGVVSEYQDLFAEAEDAPPRPGRGAAKIRPRRTGEGASDSP
jgi:glycosyltransferase involved in cell wall biosynthesis